MTTDELAEKIKAKYPDYADVDNQTLVEKITSKYPEYKSQLDPAYDTSLAGRDARISMLSQPMVAGAQAGLSAALPSPQATQPIQGQTEGGLSSTPMAAVNAAVQTLRDPTRISPTFSQPGQIAGDKVSSGLQGLGVNPLVAKGAGVATSVALDPQSYVGMGEGAAKAASEGISSFSDKVNEGLAKLSQWKLGASVPEKAADIAEASKFKLPTPSQEEIETGVEKVQQALSDAKNKAGKALNDAKSSIGIPTTVEEKEASLLNNGSTHGLGKDEVNSATQAMLDSKTPEDLASNIAQFKQMASSGNSDPKLTARVANALQDKVNQFVDWNKTGSDVEGVLKQQYKALGDIVTNNAVGLQGAKGQMSKVLDVFDDLKNKLGDTPGKAETFLRNLFTKDNPTNRAYLDKLGQLEHLSGKPVLSDLFKQFAGEAFDKTSGSPKLASAAVGAMGESALHMNPLGVASSAGYLAAQSPSLIKIAGRANAKASEALAQVAQNKVAKFGLNAGLVRLNNNPTLQSVRDQLNNAQ